MVGCYWFDFEPQESAETLAEIGRQAGASPTGLSILHYRAKCDRGNSASLTKLLAQPFDLLLQFLELGVGDFVLNAADAWSESRIQRRQ